MNADVQLFDIVHPTHTLLFYIWNKNYLGLFFCIALSRSCLTCRYVCMANTQLSTNEQDCIYMHAYSINVHTVCTVCRNLMQQSIPVCKITIVYYSYYSSHFKHCSYLYAFNHDNQACLSSARFSSTDVFYKHNEHRLDRSTSYHAVYTCT